MTKLHTALEGGAPNIVNVGNGSQMLVSPPPTLHKPKCVLVIYAFALLLEMVILLLTFAHQTIEAKF